MRLLLDLEIIIGGTKLLALDEYYFLDIDWFFIFIFFVDWLLVIDLGYELVIVACLVEETDAKSNYDVCV